ncbi:nuclear RNA export factor 1-like [Spea bombifrons]|uniref:nuclear RNA export factor 1-like n=1 Tax=Spea bombifrons TaxID=233779 RepID=UPI00234B2BE2|nr:nuclear RNA export factor 1-like [Spea bombifrons]
MKAATRALLVFALVLNWKGLNCFPDKRSVDVECRFLKGKYGDRLGLSMEKLKGGGSFRGKLLGESSYNYQRGGGYGPNPRSQLDYDDLDTAVSDAHGSSHSRFTPYSRGARRRDNKPGRLGRKHKIHSSDATRPNRAEASDGRGSWHKITVPHGEKYERDWLISVLQNACSLPFIPIQYHCHHSHAHFYVDDAAVAKALKDISRTCTDRENFKITVLTHPCLRPVAKQFRVFMKDEEIRHFKNCMQKRYDGATVALDMKSLRSDPDLVANKVDLVLNRRRCMQAMLQIIEENVPELLSLDISNNTIYKLDYMAEIHNKAPNLKILRLSNNMLKTERELDVIKGLKLEELWLDGNPLCGNFYDEAVYIRAVRQRFPKLMRLDGLELPPPIIFEDETLTLPTSKGSFLNSDELKVFILQFLQQYYACYDGEDRQSLLKFLHDEVCCSISIPWLQGQNPITSRLEPYLQGSRNIKKLKDPSVCSKLIKHKRPNVVGFLNELPRTQHDLHSFVVDIVSQSNTLLCFTVNGIFKMYGQSSDTVLAFSRVFVAVPGHDGGLLLVNDEQFIRNATTEESHRAFAAPAPTPSSSAVSAQPPVPQDMLQAFIQFSGMNAEWSQKCLQENAWDFERAAQIFMKFKAEGVIPDVAFIK